MRKILYITVFAIIVLCIVHTVSFAIGKQSKSSYIGKIKPDEGSIQWIYVKDSLKSWNEPSSYLLINNNGETFDFPIHIDSSELAKFELIDTHYKEGKLYKPSNKWRYFSAYHTYDPSLEDQYLQFTDYIYIPNPLFSIEMEKWSGKEILTGFRDVPWDLKKMLLGKWFNRVFGSYHALDSVVFTRRSLPDYTDGDYYAYIYGDREYPELKLLYWRKGFEYAQEITQGKIQNRDSNPLLQYPVVILSEKDIKGSILLEQNGQILIGTDSLSQFKKKYALIPYRDGYLMCIGDPKNLALPDEKLLEHLIAHSNQCIYSTLN